MRIEGVEGRGRVIRSRLIFSFKNLILGGIKIHEGRGVREGSSELGRAQIPIK